MHLTSFLKHSHIYHKQASKQVFVSISILYLDFAFVIPNFKLSAEVRSPNLEAEFRLTSHSQTLAFRFAILELDCIRLHKVC